MRTCFLLCFVFCIQIIGCDSPSQHIKDSKVESRNSSTASIKAKLEIEKKIKEIVADQYGLDPNKLDVAKPLVSLGDELNVIEVIFEIEEHYQIGIPDEWFQSKLTGIHKDLSTAKLIELVSESKL